ncbi:MAG: exodeoxyribonuclease VII small subunit [Pseudomonadota bacterium]|mgnify:FL=1|nr:exodeoxyribonuclease VII small subunit [Pseudomonadota bacterium]MEC7928613.1 exodeoxyribonuclease VII small subunit [Pseudomonadota bacterium]MEC8287958.1 exodeoxyribonuclease VII small subunit [Pseudomonadota bacterium]MEC8403997.1 exodeoxyribonuclease VII small subunit [Pseudomonadota bacterium]MEC8426583.1 exodeoxyribonuclease VII small subunit [Pseudomonadota bacterium]|tara:strand:+ start:405 stop:674 length:270 start_codon:yes stop_codon:yes gene_type:complete
MSKKIDYHKIKDLDFEEAMDQLNEIIQGLESGEVKLSESVDKFELGSELAKHCKKLLDDAETRINAIKIDGAGDIISEQKIDNSDESDI